MAMTDVDASSAPRADPPLRPADRGRQVAVTLAEAFCIVGTLFGVGVLGTEVSRSSGGALAADATLLAPATPAFSIWTPIYLGLLGYTVWQWLPGQAAAAHQRAIGWLAASSMVLNALWLLVTQRGWLWTSVLVILALVATLAVLVTRLERTPAAGPRWVTAVLADGTFGLYLGWVTVATCANITATLVASGVTARRPLDDLAALGVLGAVALVGILLSRYLGGRFAVAAALIWGLAWIAVGRTADRPLALPVAVGALFVALVIAADTVRSRFLASDRS
jgi:hypothetical protein